MKRNILYLAPNNGSDMRIHKEIKTLSKEFKVFYLGVGLENDASHTKFFTEKSIIINGTHKSFVSIVRYIFVLIKILFKHKFVSVHVVDEQFYLLLLPFLLNKNVILDVFDSMFLKLNKHGEKFIFFKKIVYGPPVKILVTDENRNNLMPRFVLKKTSVLPNVPYKGKYIYGNSGSGNLTICYFGTLSRKRGSEFLNDIIKINPEIRIIAAGWVVDTYTKNLISQDNVKFLGVKSQEEVNLILAQYGDYLLGVYPLNNLNNINASPNKIYDSIHTKTPIIINKGVKVSSFVRSNNIGYIVDDTNKDMRKIVKDLILKKNGFTFSNKLIDKYCWENFEKVLIDCHQNLK